MARVSFIKKADSKPVPNRMSSTRWSRLLALPKSWYDRWRRKPLLRMASPVMNIPNKKIVTSILIDFNLSYEKFVL